MESSRFEQYARVAAVALLALGCVFVLLPFLGAILFAGVLVLSTAPGYAWLVNRWGGRRTAAALALVLGMVIALGVPVAIAAQSLVVHSASMVEAVRSFLDGSRSLELPEFVRNLPLVGASINEYWHLLLGSREELVALGKRLADPLKTLLIALGGGIGNGLIQILLALFVAFFFYGEGKRTRQLVHRGMTRLAGAERGATLIATVQNAVRGVVYGLLGTAFAQAAVAFVGFVIAGVPGAVLLGALTFILSLVPMGPVLVWGGAAAWLYATDQTGWAIFMVI